MERHERTRDGALRTLLELLQEERGTPGDDGRAVPSESLLRDIFQVAWHFQFEEDRRESRRQLRELVQDAVLATELEKRE